MFGNSYLDNLFLNILRLVNRQRAGFPRAPNILSVLEHFFVPLVFIFRYVGLGSQSPSRSFSRTLRAWP